ncbi:MAG: hypothetical protein QOF35_1854, partial [Actinomycetota bacterium]|nr:hypothetical protein [Actinomycetota bacterium]
LTIYIDVDRDQPINHILFLHGFD